MTRGQLELSIVVPVHNEEKRVGSFLRRLSTFLQLGHQSCEIIVSEDGSRDRTAEIVRGLMKCETMRIPVVLLHSPQRFGKGGGIGRGVEVARGEYTVFTDPDLLLSLKWITEAIRLLKGGADIVVGNRIMRGSGRNEPFLRRLSSYVFHILVVLLLGMHWDTQCGLKATKTNVAREVFAKMVNLGFAFDVEFLLVAKRKGATIADLPVQWHHDPNSRIRLSRDGIEMLLELARIFYRARLQREAKLRNGVRGFDNVARNDLSASTGKR